MRGSSLARGFSVAASLVAALGVSGTAWAQAPSGAGSDRLTEFPRLEPIHRIAAYVAREHGVRLAYTGPAVSGVLPQTRELRPAPLPSLYAGFAVLQALDAHSTTRALAGGAEERNPVVASVARSPAAVLGIKAAATLGTIWATERLWKRGHRRAAVLLMVALNAGYGLVVAHNYRTAGAAR